nr:hypothetical protein GCM10020093_025670 [Planobispora longispora]
MRGVAHQRAAAPPPDARDPVPVVGKNSISSSPIAASTSGTGAAQWPNRRRRSSAAEARAGSPGSHRRSNHHWSRPSPAGISPHTPSLPTISNPSRPPVTPIGMRLSPCQVAQPLGSAGSAPHRRRRTAER